MLQFCQKSYLLIKKYAHAGILDLSTDGPVKSEN